MDHPNPTEDELYQYDPNGNRARQQDDPTLIDKPNQIRFDGTFFYEYDRSGNRTSALNLATGELTRYTWDLRHRLVKVETVDLLSSEALSSLSNLYDVFNQQIGRIADPDGNGSQVAEAEHYVHDQDQIALIFDG